MKFLILISPQLTTNYQITTKYATISKSELLRELNTLYSKGNHLLDSMKRNMGSAGHRWWIYRELCALVSCRHASAFIFHTLSLPRLV